MLRELINRNNDPIDALRYYVCATCYKPRISKVIFNGPATIVMWTDGSKTIVKCSEDDYFDKEKGLAMAICKKILGNDFKKVFKEYVPEEDSSNVEAIVNKTTQFNNNILKIFSDLCITAKHYEDEIKKNN